MTQSNQKCPSCNAGSLKGSEQAEGVEYGTTHIAEWFSCGHVAISIILPDHSKTEPVLFSVVRNPVDDVKKAYEDKDYVKAITYACALIEYYGKRILIKEFRSKGIEIGRKKVANLSLNSALVLLYSHNLIDKPMYDQIMNVKDFRNDIMHIEKYEKLHLRLYAEGDAIAKKALEGIKGIVTLAGKFEV